MSGRALAIGAAILAGVVVVRRRPELSETAAAALGLGTKRVWHRQRLGPVDPQLLAFLDEWDRSGPFRLVVTSGVRTDADQLALYQQGRPGGPAGPIVTNARTAERSAHGLRLRSGQKLAQGIDVAVYERGAAGLFAPTYPDHAATPAEAERLLGLYREIGRRAKAAGLVWGGDWSGLVDLPHVETADWTSLPYAGGLGVV